MVDFTSQIIAKFQMCDIHIQYVVLMPQLKMYGMQVFEDVIWPKIINRAGSVLKPSLVFLEINSYIKGSAEALRSPHKHLTCSDYLQVDNYSEVVFLAQNMEGSEWPFPI